jgi:hypothetical protein
MAAPVRRARLNNPAIWPFISEEHAAAIGYVALRWSEVESALKVLIRDMLGIGSIADALTAELPTIAAVNLCTVLIDLTDNDEWIDRWNAIEKRIEEARPKRNDAIHAEWQAVGKTHIALRSHARRKYQFRMIPIETKALNDLSDFIVQVAEDIVRFCSLVISGQKPNATALINQDPPPGAHRRSIPTPTKPKTKTVRPRKLSSAQKRARQAGKGDAP